MSDETVRINATSGYVIARDENGARMWQVTARPSVITDPSFPVQIIEWQVWGPNLISYEVIPVGQPAGYLGVDYGDDTESRWDSINCLAPAITNLDLSGTSGTRSNIQSFALSSLSMNSNGVRLYAGRGNHLAKIKPSDMSRVVEASANLGANVTDLLYTRAAGGTEGIAIAEGDAAAYQVLTTVANDASNDTISSAPTNNFTKLISSGLGADNRIFGAQGTTSSTAARLYGNILTGTVTMAAPNWIAVGTLAGDNVTIGSLGIDGNFLMVGTNGGLYTVDPAFSSFRPIDPETPLDTNNCKAIANWMPIGTFFSLARSLRFIKWGQGASCGPENFLSNTSPVRGRVTAIVGSDRWAYAAVLDEITGTTYLCAVVPKKPGDPHSNPVSWYTLRKLASAQVDAFINIGTVSGVRTLPTIVGSYHTGSVDDIFYFGEGRTARWPDDTSYTYAASGTTYLTEARRDPGVIKDIEAVEFETANCSAAKTVTVGISFDGAAAVTLSAVTTNGYQRLLPVSAGVPLAITTWSGRRLKPQLAYATNDVTSSPQVTGKLRVHYRARPIMTEVLTFSVDLLQANIGVESPRQLEAQLLTEWGAGPILIEFPDAVTTVYCKVTAVQVQDIADNGANRSRSAGVIKRANITAIIWPVSSGQ